MDSMHLDRAENTISASTFGRSAPQEPKNCIVPSESLLRFVVETLTCAGRLTPVRIRVLELVLLGRQYGEIAEILGKSPNTVASQVKSILEALGADSTRDLFRIFLTELDRRTQDDAASLLAVMGLPGSA